MGKDIWNYFEITLHVLGETGSTAIKEDKTGYTGILLCVLSFSISDIETLLKLLQGMNGNNNGNGNVGGVNGNENGNGNVGGGISGNNNGNNNVGGVNGNGNGNNNGVSIAGQYIHLECINPIILLSCIISILCQCMIGLL